MLIWSAGGVKLPEQNRRIRRKTHVPGLLSLPHTNVLEVESGLPMVRGPQ